LAVRRCGGGCGDVRRRENYRAQRGDRSDREPSQGGGVRGGVDGSLPPLFHPVSLHGYTLAAKLKHEDDENSHEEDHNDDLGCAPAHGHRIELSGESVDLLV